MEDSGKRSGRPYDSIWCPHARLGFCRSAPRGVEMLPSQGVNMLLTYRSPEDSNPQVALVARCQGDACPHYRAPFFGTGRPRCMLGEHESHFADFVTGIAALAVLSLAALIAFCVRAM